MDSLHLNASELFSQFPSRVISVRPLNFFERNALHQDSLSSVPFCSHYRLCHGRAGTRCLPHQHWEREQQLAECSVPLCVSAVYCNSRSPS